MMNERQTQELLVRIDERTKSTNEKIDTLFDLSKNTRVRVSRLEVWRGWITGALAVLGVVLGILLKVVS